MGWTGSDDKSIPSENKLHGNARMRVDLEFKRLQKQPFFTMDFFNTWAAHFYRHGWRGRRRNGNETWGARPVTQTEFDQSGGTMQYRPREGDKGVNDRPGDRENLLGFLQEFGRMLTAIGGG